MELNTGIIDNSTPPLLYETLKYCSADGHLPVCTLPVCSDTLITETRFPFLNIALAEAYTCNWGPGSAWDNAATYPTMFERVALEGTAWEESFIPGQPAGLPWMLKVAKTGCYKLKIRCNYYALTFSGEGSQMGEMRRPLQLGLFLMKTGSGELAGLASEDVGVLGSKESKAVLLGSTKQWTGFEHGTNGAGVPSVVRCPTSPFAGAEILATLKEGDEVIPYVAAYCATDDGIYNTSAVWESVCPLSGICSIGVYADQPSYAAYEPSLKLIIPATNDTSFGYELVGAYSQY